MKILFVAVILLNISFLLNAQGKNEDRSAGEPISDNSFLIEEAYNQEERVVQHISNWFYRQYPSRTLIYSFTQEWPLYKYHHQISYTIPYSYTYGPAITGFGDILINYRYQAFYEDDWACFSPRISVILPTGNYRKGLGYNVPGIQLNLPVSKQLSDSWVVHFNAGATILPHAWTLLDNSTTIKKTLKYYDLGGSIIWLVSHDFNLLLEYLKNFNSTINQNGAVEHYSETIINPGFRVAINLKNLQIVPGFSVPVIINRQKTEPGLFFYLSFEHPY